jgi:hypothetical protein
MSALLTWLETAKTNILPAAIVSLVVSAFVTWAAKCWETRDTAEIAYRYEQRKKQHEVIGRHYGRLIAAANTLGYRMWNLYTNGACGWLTRGCDGERDGYYFKSTAYRLMHFFALVRSTEKEAILLDGRIASPKDYLLLNYIEAFHWVMTDTALFKGLPYNHATQGDHFFADEFRRYCELCNPSEESLTFDGFSTGPYVNPELSPVLGFLDGLAREEPRLRWDRLIALHLLLQAFLNDFGYRRQHASKRRFDEIAAQVRNPKILANLEHWLPRHELGRKGGTRLVAQAIKRLNPQREPTVVAAGSV